MRKLIGAMRVLALSLWAACANAEGAIVITPTLAGTVAVESWKTLRDRRVVKQDLDYSCGAASLATLLNSMARL